VEILETSSDRTGSPCSKQERCGGCPWLVARVDAQHRWLRALVANAIRKAGAGRVEIGFVPSPMGLGYRRRARLHVTRGELGYRARRDRALVAPDPCVVLAEPLRRAFPEAAAIARGIAGDASLQLAIGPEDRPVLGIDAEQAQPVDLYRSVEDSVARGAFAGAILRAYGAAARFGVPEERWPGPDGPMRAPLGSFAQANGEVNLLLVEHTRREAAAFDQRVLELFAGAGNLSVALARDARELVTVEQDREAVEAARGNLGDRGLRARLVHGDAATPPAGRFDVVVLDPPRAGAGAAIGAVIAAEPTRIVYVSCHVGVLGRDLGELLRAGYEARHATAFEMFPGTGHVESVVTLARR
jgi:23S rRNA (uracil1939-C5)-methyltransferase